jgi:putative dehydrogenase
MPEEPNTKPAIGVIGLGIMGTSYARNLLRAGYPVVGFDVAASALATLVEEGGEASSSPGEVATRCEVVVLALARPEILLHVCLGSNGIAASGHTGNVVIEMSTLPIAEKERCRDGLAAAGITMLDCPVSGTGAQAARAELDVYASGDADAIERVRPVLAGFTRQVYAAGPFGAGMKLKYVANLLVTIHNLATAEALLLAQRSGLDLGMVLAAIRTGAGNSRIFELRGPMMAENRYEPATAKFDVHMKDIMLILEFALEMRSPTPLLAASMPHYVAALAEGRDKQDTAGLFAVLNGLRGHNLV